MTTLQSQAAGEKDEAEEEVGKKQRQAMDTGWELLWQAIFPEWEKDCQM